MTFIEKLKSAWKTNESMVCVGLDPDLAKLPTAVPKTLSGLFEFNKAIVDATADLVCAFKPQIAYFAALSAEDVLKDTMDYIRGQYPNIPIILDAKRSDIGSTAEQYAREAFERYQADAVTVNPYLGGEALTPFLDYQDKGIIILCRTSNPGAAELQDLEIDGDPLFLHVARKAATHWNRHNNCGLVVGATWPSQLRQVRQAVGDIPLLVPGVGAQGGSAHDVVQNGTDSEGLGLIINSSRGVLYASSKEDYPAAARREANHLKQLIKEAGA